MAVDIPGYKILSTLGKGGMATVYLAEHELFRRKVALKVMSQGLADDPSFGERFMREARIVSQLVHPNIVTVYDVGVHEGIYYLSMEYIDGKDLKHVRHKLTLEQKINVILDISKALAYAGNKGYVHRDIKPENIMLYTDDSRAVLTDFGIARATEMEKSVTVTGTAIGTPHYMSPEQAKGQPVDIRSDIYGLGVVFYLLIVGYVPYDAESAVAIGIKHITDPIPELPEGLEGLQYIIDKMMAKLPQERYQNPMALVQDLRSLNIASLVDAAEKASSRAEKYLNAANTDAPTVISRPSVSRPASGSSTAAATRIAVTPTFAEHDPTPVVVEEENLAFEQDEGNSAFPWIAGLAVLLAVAGGVYYSQYKLEVDNWLMHQRETVISYFPQDSEELEATVDSSRNQEPVDTEPTAAVPAQSTDEPPLTPEPDLSAEDSAIDDQVQPATEPEPELNSDPRVDTVEQRIADLNAQVDTDASNTEPLVASWREWAELTGDTEAANAAIDELQANEIARIEELLRVGEDDVAAQRLTQLSDVFTDKDMNLDRLEQFVAQQQQIQQWLQEGDEFLTRDALTRPANENALARFEQVLAVDARNARALEGLERIATRLAQLAATAMDAGETERAQTLLTRALEVDPDNETALRLQERSEQSTESNEQLEALLQNAESALEEADYFEPRDQSAYHYFAQVLALQPNNTAAQRGISRTIDGLDTRLFHLIEAGHYEAVRSMMQNARSVLPDNQQLAALELRVDQAIAEKMLAEEPRITDIEIRGNEENTEVAGESQEGVIYADRSITVSFSYENFKTDTTVIQATLMDGARSVRIAQVPVVITGSEGSKTFRIDRPVDRFSSGRYTVDLYLKENRLAEREFQVQ